MEQGLFCLAFVSSIILLLSLLCPVVLLIDQSLLSLDIPEHVLALWQRYKVGKYLGVLVVEVTQFGKSHR